MRKANLYYCNLRCSIAHLIRSAMRKRKKAEKETNWKVFSFFFFILRPVEHCLDLGSDSAKTLIFKFKVKKQKRNSVELPKYLIRLVGDQFNNYNSIFDHRIWPQHLKHEFLGNEFNSLILCNNLGEIQNLRLNQFVFRSLKTCQRT